MWGIINKLKTEGTQSFIAVGSAIVAIVYALFNFARYIYWCGFFNVYGLDVELININNINAVFEIVFICVIVFAMIIFGLFCFNFISSSYEEIKTNEIPKDSGKLEKVLVCVKDMPIVIIVTYILLLAVNIPICFILSVKNNLSLMRLFILSLGLYYVEIAVPYLYKKKR